MSCIIIIITVRCPFENILKSDGEHSLNINSISNSRAACVAFQCDFFWGEGSRKHNCPSVA